jgi:hypothetical protein
MQSTLVAALIAALLASAYARVDSRRVTFVPALAPPWPVSAAHHPRRLRLAADGGAGSSAVAVARLREF